MCDSLPLLAKYFILLAIMAVLSLESRYENIVASSQSSTTVRPGGGSEEHIGEAYRQWERTGKVEITTTGHLDWQ